MRRIVGLAMMGTVAVAAGVATVDAQQMSGDPSTRMVRVGFGGGLSVPMAAASDAFDSGYNGQAYVLINLGVLAPLRFNLGYQKFDLKSAFSGGTEGSTRILSGVGGIAIDLIQVGPVRPYLTAGIGAFNVKDEVVDGLALPDGVDSSSTKFGIDGGAGVAVRIGRLEGFLEARVQNVYTDAGVVDASSIRSLPVTFGFLF